MGERVNRRLALPDLLGDLDLLELTERFRFLTSAREPCESASDDGDRLRRLSLTGVTDLELVGDLRRRRGGVRDRDLDSLGAGERDFLGGEIDVEVCLGNLLLS